MIFIANNCDALSASKILMNLLKQSNIQFTSVPVFSYDDIESNLKQGSMSEDIKSLIFLNCGAGIDFTKYWFSSDDTVKTFVFDSQRPIRHNNILSQKAVYVVTDGDISIADVPEDADFDNSDNEAEGEDQPVDGEKEYQMIINGGQQQQFEDEKSSNPDQNNLDDGDFETDLVGRKRKRSVDDQEEVKKNKIVKQERIDNYYCGTAYSKP